MALPKKGQRKIIVNEQVFYWKVRKKISHNEAHDDRLGIAIQADSDGQILWAKLDYSRSGTGYETKKVLQIKPNLIRKCILKAIDKGWEYNSKGKLMELDCTEFEQE